MQCEILIHNINRRGTEMLTAMADSGGIDCKISQRYTASTPWLMSYGLGHLQRKQWSDAHIRNGGKLIGWDLGYWDRLNTMRLTIGADHPWKLIKDMPPERWQSSGLTLADSYDPDGHILLIGMGVKSRAQFGYRGQQWELDMLQKIQQLYPGRRVIYKPKKPEPFVIKSFDVDIRHALKNCALVVCRHSNVAIDACLHNIPVVCHDGAGRALYTDNLHNPVHPTYEQRLKFLQNLAWWQYKPSEAKLAWKFIKGVLNEN